MTKFDETCRFIPFKEIYVIILTRVIFLRNGIFKIKIFYLKIDKNFLGNCHITKFFKIKQLNIKISQNKTACCKSTDIILH